MALGLGLVRSAAAQSTPAPQDATPGYYDMGVATRIFRAPLFGNDSLTAYHLFGNQRFGDAGTWSLWFSGGFPGYSPQYGVQGDGIRVGDESSASVAAGDILLGSLEPLNSGPSTTGTYALEGASVRVVHDRVMFSVFGGRSKYLLEPPGFAPARPEVFGAEGLVKVGRNSFGGGWSVLEDPVYLDPQIVRGRDAVLSGRYFFGLSPWARMFAEAFLAEEGSLGGRVGGVMGSQAGGVSFSLFRFDESFPWLYPVYRPGERGLEVRGRYALTEISTLYGNVYYASDRTLFARSDLRGTLGLGLRFGSNRPTLHLDYSRDDLVSDSLLGPGSRFAADRYAASLYWANNAGQLTLTLERNRAEGAALDRDQALVLFRRSVGPYSFLDGSAVIQRDELGGAGATAEAAVERPLRGRFSYLTGLGAAYVDRAGLRSGEGVARVGLSRRLSGQGWSMRAELRIPFSIGLERSETRTGIFSLELGNRYSWSDLAAFGSGSSNSDSGPSGSVRGTVRGIEARVGGIPVLLDGQPRAITHADGSFRMLRVPAGTHSVSLDLGRLDPRYGVAGEDAKVVEVYPGVPTEIDLELARFSAFDGALVTCRGEPGAAVAGARLTLVAGGERKSAVTSNVGGFHFDEVVPGTYVLVVSPSPLDPAPHRWTVTRFSVDLRGDCLGQLVEVLCRPGSGAGSPSCLRPSSEEEDPPGPDGPLVSDGGS